MPTFTDQIATAVSDELIFDPAVDATTIRVFNVRGGVALHGTAPSYPAYLAAAAAARRVRGVTRVHNHLEVVIPASSYRDDVQLATATNNALAAAGTVPADVEATVSNGDVRLSGVVSWSGYRAAAERVVADLVGVRGVHDEIEVVTDIDLLDLDVHLRAALGRHALVADDSDIRTRTDGHLAVLSGHVRTWAEHDAVVDAAWMVRGVETVEDDIVVTG